MDKKYLVAVVFASILLIGVATTQAITSDQLDNKDANQVQQLKDALEQVNTEDVQPQGNANKMRLADPEKAEKLRTKLAEVREAMPTATGGFDESATSVYPVERRFILWTHDGVNVMWGTYGDGYFEGEDNSGAEIWGIYEDGAFAGFRDGELFYGNYWRGRWKAYNLYGNQAYGGFKLFPSPWMVYGKPMPMGIGPGFPTPEIPAI